MLTLFGVPAFRNAYLRRGAIVWGGLRLALLAGQVSDPTVGMKALILALAATAVMFDARYRREDVFLGNLGIPLFATGLCALSVPLIAEILLP